MSMNKLVWHQLQQWCGQHVKLCNKKTQLRARQLSLQQIGRANTGDNGFVDGADDGCFASDDLGLEQSYPKMIFEERHLVVCRRNTMECEFGPHWHPCLEKQGAFFGTPSTELFACGPNFGAIFRTPFSHVHKVSVFCCKPHAGECNTTT